MCISLCHASLCPSVECRRCIAALVPLFSLVFPRWPLIFLKMPAMTKNLYFQKAGLIQMVQFDINLIRRNKLVFQQYTQQRRRYAFELNAEKASIAFELIPVLLSLNEPDLPGHVADGGESCGVYNIGAARKLKELIQSYFPETRKRRIPYQKYLVKRPIIETLFVMGSVGTVAQTEKSDYDYWVCVNSSLFEKDSIQKLCDKTDRVADWCEREFGMEVHFFVSELDRVRNNDFGSVDEESTGSSQKRFLKEECYRTMLLVAGGLSKLSGLAGKGGRIRF